MKIVKGILMALVALVFLLVLAALVFIKTFDVNCYKPQIISQARAALGRDVDFQNASLALSWAEGVRIKVAGLVIGEDPAFKKDGFFAVKDISLGVDMLGYFLRKKVVVSDILIDSPRMTIIRLKDGAMNVQSLGKVSVAEAQNVPAASAPAVASAALPAVLIHSLKIIGGTLMVVDQSFQPALTLEVSDLTVTVSQISLTEPFPFIIEGAVLAAKKNVRIQGKAQADLKTGVLVLCGVKATTDLSALLLEKIPTFFPMVKGVTLPLSLKGMVDATIEKLTVGPQGLRDLAANVVLTDGALEFKELVSPIAIARMGAKVTSSKIILEKTSIGIGAGEIVASGTLENYPTVQDFQVVAEAKGLRIRDFVLQDKSAVRVEGVLSGEMKVKGQGFTLEALALALALDGAVDVQKAALKNINVLRTVLDKISIIPGLSEKLEASLPERYKQKLSQTDTVLADIHWPVAVAGGRFVVDDTVIGAEEFMFKGRTEAGFDGAYSLEGSFLIPTELSKAMVVAVPQLQYLLNPEHQVYIPLKVSGKYPEVVFNVDAKYIGERLLLNQAKVQLANVIEKALGFKKGSETPQGPEQAGASTDFPQSEPSSSGTQEKSSAETLAATILNTVFKQ